MINLKYSDLNVALSNLKANTNREIKPSFSIQEFVNNKIQWSQI